jgi:spermidine/putrescine transport system permease protein
MSFENFNTTLMVVGSDAPLTIYMYGQMREGSTPVINAVSVVLMVATGLLALALILGTRERGARADGGPALGPRAAHRPPGLPRPPSTAVS